MELMVVVGIIGILLTITFKIVGVGEDASKRNLTLTRLQRLENALSGYFAAFGSYPPVALHTKRNVYAELDMNGNQRPSGETTELVWESVRKACESQPVAARFPFPKDREVQDYVETVSRIVVNRVNSSDAQWANYRKYNRQLGGGFTPLKDPNQVNGWDTKRTWEEVKIFEFGVMSFLLPRYLFMTQGLDEDDLADCAQWDANNRLSAHPNTGASFGTWRDQLMDQRLVKRIPSQAVCARWMPNFEKMLRGNPIKKKLQFFGIDVSDGTCAMKVPEPKQDPGALANEVYLDQNRTVLDKITVLDGWENEFYYYSAPPFQSYRLWSAGPNGKTFPPWVPFETLKSDSDRKTAANWMADDIMYLSN